MMKRFYLKDPVAKNDPVMRMNQAEVDIDIDNFFNKKDGGVKKNKPGGEKLKSSVIDAENCLYLIWSPYYKESYLGMSSRGEAQRWK